MSLAYMSHDNIYGRNDECSGTIAPNRDNLLHNPEPGTRVELSTGTLYGALKRMLESAWIERVENPEPDDSSRGRKAYRLTKLGRRILKAEMARLRQLVNIAELRTEGKTI